MKKLNVLSKAELKMVKGGVLPEDIDEPGNGYICRFKYKYEGSET